jgi:hypothetical protein
MRIVSKVSRKKGVLVTPLLQESRVALNKLNLCFKRPYTIKLSDVICSVTQHNLKDLCDPDIFLHKEYISLSSSHLSYQQLFDYLFVYPEESAHLCNSNLFLVPQNPSEIGGEILSIDILPAIECIVYFLNSDGVGGWENFELQIDLDKQDPFITTYSSNGDNLKTFIESFDDQVLFPNRLFDYWANIFEVEDRFKKIPKRIDIHFRLALCQVLEQTSFDEDKFFHVRDKNPLMTTEIAAPHYLLMKVLSVFPKLEGTQVLRCLSVCGLYSNEQSVKASMNAAIQKKWVSQSGNGKWNSRTFCITDLGLQEFEKCIRDKRVFQSRARAWASEWKG